MSIVDCSDAMPNWHELEAVKGNSEAMKSCIEKMQSVYFQQAKARFEKVSRKYFREVSNQIGEPTSIFQLFIPDVIRGQAHFEWVEINEDALFNTKPLKLHLHAGEGGGNKNYLSKNIELTSIAKEKEFRIRAEKKVVLSYELSFNDSSFADSNISEEILDNFYKDKVLPLIPIIQRIIK